MALPGQNVDLGEPKIMRHGSRFSLRMMFVAVTGVAVLLYLLISAPTSVAAPGLYLVNTLLVAFFLAGALYGNENLKAFCRGAVLPFAIFYLYLTYMSFVMTMEVGVFSIEHWNEVFQRSAKAIGNATILFISASVLLGAATVGFKHLLEPRDA